MSSLGKDLKGETTSKFALTSTAVTAGGTGDATEIDGASIDTTALGVKAQSVLFSIPCRAVLGATQTLTVIGNLQDSADNSTWADINDSATLLTLTGGSGGTTETGVARMGFDLTRARRYVRCQVTPDLNRANTDTAVIGAGVATFGGLQTA
mgnify:CR=1 FL=1